MRKNYYQHMAFMGMLLIILFTYQNYTSEKKTDFSDITFIPDNHPSSLSGFNPNDLGAKQWQNLGFSPAQASVILKYKKVIGGSFASKDQLRKCYAISPEKFAELEDYILLPEQAKADHEVIRNPENTVTVSNQFDPDQLSADDWIRMGFTKKQAQAILKYKSYLGGSFISKEKLKECFVISEENYRKMAPYIILPEKSPSNRKNPAKTLHTGKHGIPYTAFDPNLTTAKDWIDLGFSDKQAKTIINYRDNTLKGSFKNLEDIRKCYVISDERFKQLKPYLRLNPATMHRNDRTDIQQEKTDFSKTDLNSITFRQLLEFGLDERSAGSIIGFRRKLGGFMSKQQILDTYNINKELVQKLLSVTPLDTSGVPRYTLHDAPEEWLKNHPYFRYSADKIIFYRVSERDEKKIWKLLKIKPEYEARMKLYLR